MRILVFLASMVLAAALAVLPAAAQDSGQQDGPAQQEGMPPSAAVKRAMQANPGAKPLGVKLQGGIYVVRLKQDGTIVQVGVDPVTGDVFPLQ
jgi:hypothetical protein